MRPQVADHAFHWPQEHLTARQGPEELKNRENHKQDTGVVFLKDRNNSNNDKY